MRVHVIAAALAGVIGFTGAASANDPSCSPAVQNVLDENARASVNAWSDLASQNFSRRPGTFAETTCLENLMKGGGVDIFFQPGSLDNILGQVKNLACEQASRIFEQAVGSTIGNLNPGEVVPGLSINAGLSGGSRGGVSSINGSRVSLGSMFR